MRFRRQRGGPFSEDGLIWGGWGASLAGGVGSELDDSRRTCGGIHDASADGRDEHGHAKDIVPSRIYDQLGTGWFQAVGE